MSGIWDGAEVISAYTRAQALEDGTLVPVIPDLIEDEPKFAEQAGFTVPVALTATVAALVRPTEEETSGYGQDVKGRLWDVLNMARLYRTRPMPPDGDTWEFPCIFWMAGRGEGRARQVTKRLVCSLAPGDDGAPVVTIMFPDES